MFLKSSLGNFIFMDKRPHQWWLAFLPSYSSHAHLAYRKRRRRKLKSLNNNHINDGWLCWRIAIGIANPKITIRRCLRPIRAWALFLFWDGVHNIPRLVPLMTIRRLTSFLCVHRSEPYCLKIDLPLTLHQQLISLVLFIGNSPPRSQQFHPVQLRLFYW